MDANLPILMSQSEPSIKARRTAADLMSGHCRDVFHYYFSVLVVTALMMIPIIRRQSSDMFLLTNVNREPLPS